MLSPFSSYKLSSKTISKKLIASVVVIAVSFIAGFGGAIFAIYDPPSFIAGKLGTVRVNPPLPQQQTSGNANTADNGSKTVYVPQTSEEDQVISVVKQNSPSVVSVIATKDVPVVTNPFYSDPFFQQLFPDLQPQQGQGQTQKQQVSAGTGFVVSQDGLILTNKHVVADTQATYTVVTLDGKTHNATVLARDPFQDLAVLRALDVHLPALTLGNSDGLAQGQMVIAIGNALGQFQNTVSVGVISGLSRTITANNGGMSSETLQQVIQTDAAINPGNSGGPLLNLAGQVVGINAATAQNAQNIGFAIPINTAKKDIDQVRSKGKISYPFLGVRYTIITPQIQQQNSLTVDYGALVLSDQNTGALAVTPGSPADKAGIVENDVILEISGQKITSDNTLADIIGTHTIGDTITLLVLHKGAQETLRATLTEAQ